MTSLTRARARLKDWRYNPVKFAYENFKFEPDEWQKEFLEACGGPDNPRRRVGAKACTGPGKTAVLAIAGWHRLSCFGARGQHPKGAALSGEGRDNLRDGLWAELSKWQQRSEFLKTQFVWTGEKIYNKDFIETWFLSMRSYAKDANPEQIGTALSGLHSDYPFLLLEETGRMPVIVGQKAQQIFTGGVVDGFIGQTGNPVTDTGLLYHSSVIEAALWTMITITADPDDPRRTPRVDPAHARQMIALYGRDNPWVMSTILGLFPKTNANSLFSADEIEARMGLHLPETTYNFVQKKIGVDVALYGDDRTVLFPRQGLASFTPTVMRTQEPADISARLIMMKKELSADMELVDDTGGWGSGVISHARMAGISPQGIQAAGAALDPRYYNKRAETWFLMRDWLRSGGILPNIKEIVAELTTTEYSMKDGRLLLEPKALVKKKLGRSPDLADALALTFATPDVPKHRAYSGGQSAHRSDWDPLK
jgi:hypothetical protein